VLKQKTNWILLIFLLASLATFWSFHPQTRLRLAGDWTCVQQNNGVVTRETYGFFGARDSINPTPRGPLHFIGSYSISGTVITNRPEFAEANGNRMPVKLDDGGAAEIYEEIISLTTKKMSLKVTTNLLPKTATYICEKN